MTSYVNDVDRCLCVCMVMGCVRCRCATMVRVCDVGDRYDNVCMTMTARYDDDQVQGYLYAGDNG